jgi:hypothetical protein
MKRFRESSNGCLSGWTGWALILWVLTVSARAADREYAIEGKTYGAGLTSYTVAVPDDLFLDRVAVRLVIEAGGAGSVDDLDVSLVSPLGTTVKLLAATVLGDEVGFLSGSRLEGTLFSESGTDGIESGMAPYVGTFRVDNWTLATGLGKFRNQRSLGNWTLRIRDAVGFGGTVFGGDNRSAAGWSNPGSALIMTPLEAGSEPPSLTAASDTGLFSTDGVTRITTPTLTGKATAGATVKIQRGSGSVTVIGTVVAGADGVWTFTVPSPLAPGSHDFSALVTHPTDSSVTLTGTKTVVVDTTAPTVSELADQTIDEGADTDLVRFLVSDDLTAAAALTVSSRSSNAGLVGDIVSGGSGTARNVVVKPASGRSGSGLITVTVMDFAGNATDRSFLLTVIPGNKVPVAGADQVSRSAGGRVVKVLLSDLLANDTDADGDALSIDSVQTALPAGAFVKLMEPYVVYTVLPGTDIAGSFEYVLSDGVGGHRVTNTVPVTVVSGAGPDEPARPLTAVTDKGDVVLTWIGVARRNYKVQFSTSQQAPYTWNDHTTPAVYTASRTGALGVFRHQEPMTTGPVRLYRAIPMGWANDAPVLGEDRVERSVFLREITIKASTLLANDTDADGDALSVVSVSGALPLGATVELFGEDITYTVASGAAEGSDESFQYEVSDGLGGHRVSGTVRIKTIEGGGPP